MRSSITLMMSGLSLLVLLLPTTRVAAQTTPEIVSRGKQATALVFAESRRVTGTAFCIDPAGYFVTNAHVAGKAGDSVKLVLLSGEDGEQVVSGRVVRVDEDADLALLHYSGETQLTALEPGTDDALFETQEVTVFGYPLGTALALRNQDYPNITVSVGRISAIRRSQNKSAAIQLDAVINPGNSGGPVLDAEGKVIGVVVAKIRDTDLNLAIPVSKLTTFLARPDVAFTPPSIAVSQRHQPLELTVRVTTFDGQQRNFKVRMEWSSGADDRRNLTLESADGCTFKTSVIPVPLVADPDQLEMVARFERGAVQGLVKDSMITLDEHQTTLREIRRISAKPDGYELELPENRRLNGSNLQGLPTAMQIGDQIITIQLSQARELLLAPPTDGKGAITYTLVVLEGDTELLRESGRIILQSDLTLPDIAGNNLLPLGGESPFPAFLEAGKETLYESNGLRTKDRNYVRTRSNTLLTSDFTAEVVFELQPGEKNDWGNVVFIGIGTVERAAYDEPQNCAYLRITPLHVNGDVGLSNRPVDSGTIIGKFRSVGPHLARIRRKGELVIFEVDVDRDGPSPDDFSRTIPDIHTFVPSLHEKNTHFFFGGAALFKQVSFQQSPETQP
ncbi:MAG: Serine protease Do-like HtrA [Planctomycetota bacterium]|jgi:hypothetical protein